MSKRKRLSFIYLMFTLFVMQQLFSFISIPILNDLDNSSIELIGDHFQDDSDDDKDGPEENDTEENEEESEDDLECYSSLFVFAAHKVDQNDLTQTHSPQHVGKNPFSPPEMIS